MDYLVADLVCGTEAGVVDADVAQVLAYGGTLSLALEARDLEASSWNSVCLCYLVCLVNTVGLGQVWIQPDVGRDAVELDRARDVRHGVVQHGWSVCVGSYEVIKGVGLVLVCGHV